MRTNRDIAYHQAPDSLERLRQKGTVMVIDLERGSLHFSNYDLDSLTDLEVVLLDQLSLEYERTMNRTEG